MTTPPPDQPQYPQQPYGQQPYPPQGYPPQQPPKKKRKWPWIIGGIIVVIIVIVIATSGGGSDDSSTTAADPGTSTAGAAAPAKATENSADNTVVYEVTSDSGTANNITYFGQDGNQSQETGAALPWRSKPFDKSKTTLKSVTAQNGGGGAISCRIIVDGKVQTENTSQGEYAVVSCQGKLF